MININLILAGAILLSSIKIQGQPVQDTSYIFTIYQSAYMPDQGPEIYIDEAHHNLHKRDAGLLPFTILLEQDGYSVKPFSHTKITTATLRDIELLVIVNALHSSNLGNWTLPVPSAFTNKEIADLKNWVNNGGSLLLIADHMPYAGAAQELAEAFDFMFLNGFAMTGKDFWPPSTFSIKNKGLHPSVATKGLHEYEEVDLITTFTGSAFTIPENAIPVIQFTDGHISLQPDTAWNFNINTPKVNLENYYQGAIMEFGEGKIAVFGEAAMFTAQLIDTDTKVGFNSELAPQNAQFILNLVHWLDGVKEYTGPVNISKKSKDYDRIIQLNREMENAFNKGEYLKVASFYADSAVLTGNRHEIIGRKAIDNYWTGLENRGISWQLENTDLQIFGEIAIQRGISRMKFLYNGEEQLSEVRFTLVWRKYADEWKITVDHYSLL